MDHIWKLFPFRVWYKEAKCRIGECDMEGYTRKIKIEYYQVVTVPKDGRETGRDLLFDLEKVIDIASRKSLEERTYSYYQEEARLDKMKYNEAHNYWYLNFIRLRQTKIPSRARKNKEAEPIKLGIDEYIGEDVTGLYDVDNHIIALQRNRDSLSAAGLEDYLSQLYNSKTHNIYLRPIKPLDLETRLNKAKIYRKISMRFANIPQSTFHGDTNSSFYGLIKYFNEFSAQAGIVTISLGRLRKKSLDSKTIQDTVDIAIKNKGLIDAAELYVKNSESDPVDTIDLFAEKSHDFINVKVKKLETINYLDIADKIFQKYNTSKDKILESLKE